MIREELVLHAIHAQVRYASNRANIGYKLSSMDGSAEDSQ